MSKVLVVDDDPIVLDSIVMALDSDGHKVFAAPDGRKAVAMQHETPADIVITDIFMPEKDGLETIRELRRDFPGLKIIAISGEGTRMPVDGLYCARELGANCTLVKPFTHSQLRQAIDDVLGF